MLVPICTAEQHLTHLVTIQADGLTLRPLHPLHDFRALSRARDTDADSQLGGILTPSRVVVPILCEFLFHFTRFITKSMALRKWLLAAYPMPASAGSTICKFCAPKIPCTGQKKNSQIAFIALQSPCRRRSQPRQVLPAQRQQS